MNDTKPSSRGTVLDYKQIEERILQDTEARPHLAKLRKDGIDLHIEHRGILGFIISAALSPVKRPKPSPRQRSRIRRLRTLPTKL